MTDTKTETPNTRYNALLPAMHQSSSVQYGQCRWEQEREHMTVKSIALKSTEVCNSHSAEGAMCSAKLCYVH